MKTSAVAVLLALAAISPLGDFREAKNSLEDALQGGTQGPIVEALRALAATKDARAVPLLARKGLLHESLAVREASLEALQGMREPKSTRVLTRQVSKAKAENAALLVRALRGHDGDDFMQAMRSSLGHRRWEVRLEAVKAIAAARNEAGGSLLEKAAKDDHPRVAHEAAGALEAVTGTWPSRVRKPVGGELLPDFIPTRRIAVILDASDALRGRTSDEQGGTILAYLVERLAPIVDSLPKDARFNIFTYSSRLRACFDEPALARKKAAAEAREFLARLRLEYGADLWLALRRVLKMEDLDTVYIFAAGSPSSGTLSDPDEIRSKLRGMSFSRSVLFHTVYLPTPGAGGEAAKALLEGIAKDSGGRFRTASLPIKGGGDVSGPPPEDGDPPPKTPEAGGFVVRKEKGRIAMHEWRRIKAAFDEAVEKARGAAAAAVVEGFAAGDDPRTVEWTVRRALFHEDFNLVLAAGRGLSRCKDPEAIDSLLRYARKEGKPERRIVFARLMAHLSGEKVDKEIVRFLQSTQPWAVRSAAMESLSGRDVKTAIPPLERLLHGDNPRLAAEAAATLRGLGESVSEFPPTGRSGIFPDRIDSAVVAIAVDTYETMRSEVAPPSEGEEAPPAKSRLDWARDAIPTALEHVSPGGRFNLFSFGIRVTPGLNGYSLPSAAGIDRARKFLDGLSTDPGGRDTWSLLRQVVEAGEADTLFILTDGAPEERRGVTLEGLRKDVLRLNHTRNVRIHTVLIHPDPPREVVSFLEGIAGDSGGTFLRYP